MTTPDPASIPINNFQDILDALSQRPELRTALRRLLNEDPLHSAPGPATLITQEGEEIYWYDLERFYRNTLPGLEFVAELLAAGWSLKPWADVAEMEAGILGDHVEFYSEGTDLYLSPAWRRQFGSMEELKEALDDFLIPPAGAE